MKHKTKTNMKQWDTEYRELVAKLRAYRQAMAKRCMAVATKHTPANVTVVYRKSLSGWACFAKRQMHTPRPVTRKALYIYLHECAHFHLHSNSKKPTHVQEYEAEVWAHETMRSSGIAVPRSMTRRAKAYVAYKIRQAVARGAKRIDSKARNYAALKLTKDATGALVVVESKEGNNA